MILLPRNRSQYSVVNLQIPMIDKFFKLMILPERTAKRKCIIVVTCMLIGHVRHPQRWFARLTNRTCIKNVIKLRNSLYTATSQFFLQLNPFSNPVRYIGNCNALLLHGVSVANGDTCVFFRLKIIRNTKRCSNFIMSSITLPD